MSGPISAALARLGLAVEGPPLSALETALRDHPDGAPRIADALTRAVAAASAEEAPLALLALGTAQLAAGRAEEARAALVAVGSSLTDKGEQARLHIRLAAAEAALGDRKAARARLARVSAREVAAQGDGLLLELAETLRRSGETLAAEAVDGLRLGGGGARATVQDRTRTLSHLVGVLNSAAAGTTEPLWAVLRAILEETGADRGALMLYEGSALRFQLGMRRSGHALAAEDFAWSTTIVDRALEAGRSVVVPDLSRSMPLSLASSARELGIRAAACAPLRVERKRVGASAAVAIPTVRGLAGALYVDAAGPLAFAEAEGPFLDACADCAVLAVRAARTNEALQAARSEPAGPAAARSGWPRSSAAAQPAPAHAAVPEVVTQDRTLRQVLDLVPRVATQAQAVLVRGESGTGKELLARALHRCGPRAAGPFVTLDCGAIPETLVQHELFGHERGAFTGAEEARAGLLEQASGGTLFLDEIAEASPALQAALLRALQEGEVRRLGSGTPRAVDLRLVATTREDPRALVERGELRQDLLFRLAVVELRVPPLRERPGDVAPLVAHLLPRLFDGAPPALEEAALGRLEEHPWPGNVRELENVLRAAGVLARGAVITLADVDRALEGAPLPARLENAARATSRPSAPSPAGGTLEEVERQVLIERLSSLDWNQVQTAKSLGIDRATLRRKIRRHGISRPGG